MENQHPQSLFTPVGKPEEQNHYHDQRSQAVDNCYVEVQHQSMPISSYQQVTLSAAPTFPQPPVHPAETPFGSSTPASYAPGGHIPQVGRDITSVADANVVFHQGKLSKSPSVNQQEVPSSYSSVAGNEGTTDQSGKSYGQQHMQPSHGVPFSYSNYPTESTSNPADQPLQFGPGLNRDNDLSYVYHGSAGATRSFVSVPAMPSVNSWTAYVEPGVSYSAMPPVMLSSTQLQLSLATRSSSPKLRLSASLPLPHRHTTSTLFASPTTHGHTNKGTIPYTLKPAILFSESV